LEKDEISVKLCPFCGGKPDMWVGVDPEILIGHLKVGCKSCDMFLYKRFTNASIIGLDEAVANAAEDAVDLWNRRASE
jgi:hypothetical protein